VRKEILIEEKRTSLNKMCTFSAVVFLAVAACAQQPAATAKTKGGYPLVQQIDKTVTYASAADVSALIDKAERESKNGSPIVVSEFLKLAPYTVDLEYRVKGGHGDVGLHPKSAELIYVLQGSGTLITGGNVAADRMSIDGGESQEIAKGDFLVIPEGVPHWINRVDQTIELMSIFVPRPIPRAVRRFLPEDPLFRNGIIAGMHLSQDC
jgi:mannose-6-phosphate isomerase-like protein (cupin superfamily)